MAREIRREKTGLHAQLRISINKRLLESDNLNVGRREDRNRLANMAHADVKGGFEIVYPVDALRHDVSLFCESLPEVWEHDRFQLAHYDVDEEPPPLEWILRPYIVRGCGTILFAPPGTGKSYTLIAMGASIGGGITHLWPVVQEDVLYVNLERSGTSLQRRFRAVARALGIQRREHRMHFLHARGLPFTSLTKRVARWRAEHPHGIGMIDSISRAGYGSLVKDDVANEIVDWMNAAFETWVAIGHTPRASSDHVFGAVHFDAGEDIGIKLAADSKADGALGLALEVVKSNDTRKPPIAYLAMEFEEADDGLLRRIRRAKVEEFAGLLEHQPRSSLQRIVAYLDEAGKAGATEISQKTGVSRQTVSALLKGEQFVKLGREGHEVVYAIKEDEEGLPF